MRDLWALFSGVQFSEVVDRFTGAMSTIFNTRPVLLNPIDNPMVSPVTDALNPLIELLENNDLSQILDISRLRQYVTGNTEENNALTQFIQSKDLSF